MSVFQLNKSAMRHASIKNEGLFFDLSGNGVDLLGIVTSKTWVLHGYKDFLNMPIPDNDNKNGDSIMRCKCSGLIAVAVSDHCFTIKMLLT